MKYNDLLIEKFHHDTILVQGDRVVYFDPYNIDMINMPRADIILISHAHADHCSPGDIEKVIKNDTMIIASHGCQGALAKFQQNKVFLTAGDNFEYQEVKISTLPAYNLNKYRSPGQLFHAPGDGGLGFIVEMQGSRLYFAGDTDNIQEMASLENIDVAFLPISGIYVMDETEAAQAILQFHPKIVVPIHYGSVTGNKKQAEDFKKMATGAEIRILD